MDPDPDPGGPKTRGFRIRIRNTAVMYILNFLGHKYYKVRNYEFFDIVITNLRVKTTLSFRNYVTTLPGAKNSVAAGPFPLPNVVSHPGWGNKIIDFCAVAQ